MHNMYTEEELIHTKLPLNFNQRMNTIDESRTMRDIAEYREHVEYTKRIVEKFHVAILTNEQYTMSTLSKVCIVFSMRIHNIHQELQLLQCDEGYDLLITEITLLIAMCREMHEVIML